MAGHSRRVLLIAAAAAAMVLTPAAADACPICFRESDSPLTAGVAAGVGTLLTITAGVLGGIGVIARRLVRAEREIAPQPNDSGARSRPSESGARPQPSESEAG